MSNLEKIKELEQQIKALKSEIPTIKIGNLTVKIGEKGTINVYGLGRFPVCLYFSQVQKLTEVLNNEAFADWLIENKNKLAIRD